MRVTKRMLTAPTQQLHNKTDHHQCQFTESLIHVIPQVNYMPFYQSIKLNYLAMYLFRKKSHLPISFHD